MDITPQLLKDIKLSDSFRGYNKDEVDELIERVGAAIVQLQTRLRDALERAEHAESRAANAGTRSESEETLRRTLVLAQRTADAAIAEANTEAQRTLAEAHEHAARTVAEANERASRLLTDAEGQASMLRAETETEVRRIAEESRAPLVDDIRELERVRGFLRDDIELLERHLGAQRERLRAQVAELSRFVEETAPLQVDPVPATSGIEVAPTIGTRDMLASIVPSGAAVAPAFAPPSASPSAPPADPGASGPAPWIDLPTEAAPVLDDPWAAPAATEDALRFTPIGQPSAPPVAEPQWAEDPSVLGSADFDDFDDDGLDDDAGAVAAATEAAPTSSTPFLDQLRRAVDDDTGLDEGAMSEFFGADVDDNPRSRFGRRR